MKDGSCVTHFLWGIRRMEKSPLVLLAFKENLLNVSGNVHQHRRFNSLAFVYLQGTSIVLL